MIRITLNTVSALALLGALAAAPARAQDDEFEALKRTVAEQQARIERLEALLAQQAEQALEPQTAASSPAAVSGAPQPESLRMTAPPVPAGSAGRARSQRFAIEGLDVSGDMRLRQEFNTSDADAPDRTRSVLRARLRATYEATESVDIGTQLATGDPDDPNTADVTLTGFDDDLEVSLDQVWLRYRTGGLTAFGGKFPQILQRTDMVWDGDVVPQGIGGIYAASLPGGARLDTRGIYFIVDENSGGPDSSMLGGQVVLATPLGPQVDLSLAVGYYDYRLDSLAGADAGDFRSNLMAGGRYLSDFRLLDAIAALSWNGLGERWPVTLTGNYVHNFGAAVSADSGFNLELAAGRAAQRGDWRLFYSFSEVGVDAVFAAFSHDNIALATNYRLHGLSVSHVLLENVLLDATFYHYRPLDALYAGTSHPDDWLDRIRMNLVFSF